MRPIRLVDRVGPYLGDTPRPSRLLAQPSATATPFAVARRIFGPALGDLVGVVDRTVGGAASVRRRLNGLGSTLTVEEFRIEQVVWGVGGDARQRAAGGRSPAGHAAGSTRSSSARSRWPAWSAACSAATGTSRGNSSAREAVMLAEFPVFADLLALAVVAGEAPPDALRRVCRLTGGELARDLDVALVRRAPGHR